MRLSLPNWFKCTGPWVAGLLLPLAAHAQAPGNDDQLRSVVLPLGAACAPTVSTNVGATTTLANGYANPGCGIATAPKDVWFRFTTEASGPGSTAVAIAVTGSAAGQVRVFSSPSGAGPFTAIGCAASIYNNVQAPRLVVEGLTPATTYYVSVAGYGSADTQGAFTICATYVLPNDLSVDGVQTLGQLPIPQGAPHVVRAVVTNQGLSIQAPVAVTLTVTGANAFTNTQTIAALAAGASTTVSFAAFTPTAPGTNALAVAVPLDENNGNNTQSATQQVNTTTFSYADAGPVNSGWGYGPTSNYNVNLARFTTSTTVNVTRVRASLLNLPGLAATEGKTVFGVLMNAAGNVLARSADHVVTAAEINTYVAFPLTTLVSLPPGTDIYVGLAQTYQPGQTAQYAALSGQADGPNRVGAFYVGSTIRPIALYDRSQQSFSYRLMLEAVTAAATLCPAPTNLAATATMTGATLAFTAPSGASSYSLTYAANGGAPTTLTPAPTGSPVVLSGLSPGTAYTVALTASCGGGQVSLPAMLNFTTAQAPAPYLALPVSESFEKDWLDVSAVRDAPTVNWRNTPASGVRSWRRDDDGPSANWANTLGSSGGGSQGIHSARFHSYEAPVGATGTLDLYVDLSAAGSKTLSFDCANQNGTDLLEVLVSTDGGTTFSATPLLTVGTNPVVVSPTATLTSTSATTVIRFRATSDFGSTDILFDNVRIALLTGTRNEALAATVGLYPNPAHGNFTLTVPAGPLGAATATLRNALGQVVQARPLGLPAAGGTTEFDVRGLAAGVYALQLRTADALVVKRVVVE